MFTRKRGWRDWFREGFVRQGVFSLKPMPVRPGEDREPAAQKHRGQEMTRLDLDSDPPPRR